MNRRTAECKTAEPQKGRLKSVLFLLLAFYFSLEASAQVGNCEPALGEAILDAGNVRAKILNNGALFWRGGTPVYEVPKGSGVGAIFSASVWIAGLVDGKLRGAATRYGPWEFWAGPLDEAGNPPDDCSVYDSISEIKLTDIRRYLDIGEISINLRDWPWHLGAPVIDGDGNPDNYNLTGGDLPEVFGHQRLWWVMNDRGNIHEATDTEAIGLEVQASAHAFDHPGFIGSATFYDYKIINKNEYDLTDAYLAFFNEVDLGNFDDDYVGSDSVLHLGYVYNADNDDESGYGVPPPALGVTFLKTAIAPPDGRDNDRDGIVDEPGEMIGATGFLTFNSGGGINGHPSTAQGYYYYMQSRWKDGNPVTFGGTGWLFSKTPAKFIYPGDPVTGNGWSEFNLDPASETPSLADPADRKGLTSSGPFTIISGDTLHLRFAIVWSKGLNHLDSVTALKRDVATLHVNPEAYYQQPALELLPQIAPPVFDLGFDANFPNPFSEITTLRYSLPQTMQVRLAVYDMLGREVEVLVEQRQDAGIYTINFEAGTLPSGIYLARIELDHLRFTKRMVLTR